MKKITKMSIILVACLLCTACGKKENMQSEMSPQTSQMKAICELATMDCYYHNVAKYTKEDAEGMLWWKKDMNFWIEYAGVVTVGVDVSQVNMEIDNDVVTISIPSAKVLSGKVDETTLTKDSYIVAKDSAKIGAEQEKEAFSEAQSKMIEAASQDTTLLANAQQRAQKLLEDYVNNIGNAVGKEYTIKWIYVDSADTEKAEQESSVVQSNVE